MVSEFGDLLYSIRLSWPLRNPHTSSEDGPCLPTLGRLWFRNFSNGQIS